MQADTIIERRRDAIAFLTRDAETGEDTGHLYVPCSRYGRTSAECAPVAWRAARGFSCATGDAITCELLDHLMGLVVNDHDDIAHLLRCR